MIHVTLSPTGAGDAEGTLQGHPCNAITIRTHRITPDTLGISMWDHGHQTGDGVLIANNGQWIGECSEYAATWRVSGAVGSGRLEFSE